MSEPTVFDSSALLAYLLDEEGADEVERALNEAGSSGHPHLIASVNWAEVLYVAAREARFEDVAQVIAAVDGLPLRSVDFGRDLSIAAAGFKHDNRLGLADAYAAALALLLDAPLLTSDSDFGVLEQEGLRLRQLR